LPMPQKETLIEILSRRLAEERRIVLRNMVHYDCPSERMQ
jgi:hypothetical protein